MMIQFTINNRYPAPISITAMYCFPLVKSLAIHYMQYTFLSYKNKVYKNSKAQNCLTLRAIEE